ncbi:MAG: choice-of-anchor Q domain-containing protein [Candidatus Binatia bacterium]
MRSGRTPLGTILGRLFSPSELVCPRGESSMSAGFGAAAHVLAASVLYLAALAAPAAGQIGSIRSTGEIRSGQSSSPFSSTTIASQGPIFFDPLQNTATMVVGFNLNADALPPLLAVEFGQAAFDMRFTLDHAASYDLRFDFLLAGQLLRLPDDPGCFGSLSLADVSIAKLVRLRDGAEFALNVVLPGHTLDLDGTTATVDFAEQDSRVLEFRGDPVETTAYQMTFEVSATAQSLSCEVSARLGADNGNTIGCDACVYPGFGDRVRDNDGLFVTVTVTSLCGNGTPDPGEECDEGAANGTEGSFCDAFCGAHRTFTVTNAEDGGAGSLRIAMGAANLTPGEATIVFDPVFFSTPRTIRLNGALPTIGEELTIDGPGANLLTVSGNHQDRVFDLASGVSASLSGLTITEGMTDGAGGGIRSAGPLTLRNVAVVGNHALNGGGVAQSFASGFFGNCTFSGNTADVQGGAIDFRSDDGRSLRLLNSTVSGNSSANVGGGIHSFSLGGTGTLDAINSTIVDNSAATGGGILTNAGADGTPLTTLRNSIIANNSGGNLVAMDNLGGMATVTSLGFNLTSDAGGGFLKGLDDQINTEPMLGPLQYNGGPTPTHMPLAGSPALDNGDAPPGEDQRGVARPFDIPNVGSAGNGDAADIGAVEAHALIVSNADDSGAGSLRQALMDANANADLEDILFDATFFGAPRTIRLASALPVISNSLTINGPGAALLTVSGNHENRVFEIGGVTASLSNLTISDGRVRGAGAGIRQVRGALTLTNVAVVGNHAFDFDFAAGGGVALLFANGVFTNSTFSGNTSPALGGGIEFRSDGEFTLRVIDSTISGNSAANDSGGGILHLSNASSGGTLEVINSTITGNAAGNGGGIATIVGSGNLVTTLRNSIVANNGGRNLVGAADPGGTAAVTSLGFNLTSDDGGGFLEAAGDQVNKDPLLGPLQNNGGETPTHMLLAGSPALDKGNSAGVALDQRGRPRGFDLFGIEPAAGGDNSDIGAVEAQALIVTNADDSGFGSLRQVVADAPPNSDILFDATFFNVARTIALTSGEVLIDKEQTINGPGADLLAVSGLDANRVFRVAAGGLHVAMSGLTITNGSAPDRGGGIASDSDLTLTRCRIVDNTAGSDSPGGGVHVRGSLATFTDCVFKGNTASSSGGAVFLIDATGTFTGCTLSGNEAGDRGGAIALAGSSAGLDNCTISGNSAPARGGGIALFTVNSNQTLAVTNSTVTANRGTEAGGIRVEAFGFSASATVRNSIVARNAGPNLQTVSTGGSATIASLGFNLNDDDNTFFSQPTDQIDTDPMLGPLQNNGGLTETHALLPESTAIDRGASSGASTDQRGSPRPLDDPALPNADGGDGADIGAFELALPPPAATATPTPTLPAGTATVTATPTSPSGACAGDCNGNGRVAVNELILLVNVALGNALSSACPAGDLNRDSMISINELITAVRNALNNCAI